MRSSLWRHSEGIRNLSCSVARYKGRFGSKRVLIGSSGILALTYGLKVWEAIADVTGVVGFVTHLKDYEIPTRLAQKVEALGLRTIDRSKAAFLWWDAVVLPDHVGRSQFPKRVPRISVRHGLALAKKWRGYGYQFDPSFMLWPDGLPVYSLHLSVTKLEASRLIDTYPCYEGRVRVVGDLRADRMLEMSSRADELRELLGIRAERVILLMSTWDQFSLMEQLGVPLLREVPLLLDAHKSVHVIWMMHPNLWQRRRLVGTAQEFTVEDGTIDWARRLESVDRANLTVVDPSEDWEPYLAVSDVAIADHTSLASTFGLLGRPIIPVKIPKDCLASGSFALLLQERLRPVDDAREALERALTAGSEMSDPSVRAAASGLLDHRGEAKHRTRNAILDLLAMGSGDRI